MEEEERRCFAFERDPVGAAVSAYQGTVVEAGRRAFTISGVAQYLTWILLLD